MRIAALREKVWEVEFLEGESEMVVFYGWNAGSNVLE